MDPVTISLIIQGGGLLVGLGVVWGYIKSQVSGMQEAIADNKAETNGRFKASHERHNHLESQFDEHVKESTKAREDIAEMKADLKHVARSVDRLVDREV